MAATVTNSAPCAATYARSSLIAFVIWFPLFSLTPPTSQLFHDISIPEAWPVKNVLASGRKSLQCRVQYILKRLTFFRSFIRHTTCRSRMIIYRHRIFLTLPQKGYATVPHGSSHIGSKLLLRHVIQSFVPYADKQFLHNIFRVVLVRNISIGYTAQP